MKGTMGLIGLMARGCTPCSHRSHGSYKSYSWHVLTMMLRPAATNGRQHTRSRTSTRTRIHISLLTSHVSLCPQSPSSNRMIGVKVPPPGGGGSFAIFLPASLTESSTTALPEPSTISNSVTVPSGWIFRRTLTTKVVPAGISPCGWFQAL